MLPEGETLETTMQSGEQPYPELVWDALNAHQKTAAIRAAIDLDLFTAMAEGGSGVSEISNRCNASTRGIRILCDCLTLNGFLDKHSDTYELTPTSAVVLN